MFTPDGRVREEFAAPDETSSEAAAPTQVPPEPPVPPVPLVAESPEPTVAVDSPSEPAASGARLELPGTPAGLGPGFLDLVELLAQPVPFYLGDAALPDGQSVENLEMARLHIDMLDVLRQRTAGNLTADELAVLEDLLYQLRMRYVQKRG